MCARYVALFFLSATLAWATPAHAEIVTFYSQPDNSGEMISQQATFQNTWIASESLGNLNLGKGSLSITFTIKDPSASNIYGQPGGVALGTCPSCQNLQTYHFTAADRALLADGAFHTFTVQTGTTTLGLADGETPMYILFFNLSQYHNSTHLKSNVVGTIPYLVIEGTPPPPPVIPQAPEGSITIYEQNDNTGIMTNRQTNYQSAYIDSASLGNLPLGKGPLYLTFTLKSPNIPNVVCIEPADRSNCGIRMQSYYFTAADRALLADEAFHTFTVQTGTTTSTYADGTRPVRIGFSGLYQIQYSTKVKSNAAGTIPYLVIKTPPPPDPCTNGGCVSNVLFLPGIEASRLYRPDGSGGEKKLWEPGGDADAMQIAMTATGSSARSDIYTREVIDNAYLLVKGNVYKSFLEQLAAMKGGHTIADYTVAPYDWRLSLDDILTSGKQTGTRISYLDATSTPYIIQELKRLAATSKTHKVTIIAHSNGGLLAKRLTQLLGPTESAKLIDKMIFVAVPQAGTPKAVGAILHGFEQALPVKPLSLFGMTEATARELARNMPGVYNLLPSTSYFTYADDPVITMSADPLLAPWRTAYGDSIHSGERLRDFLVDESRAALPVSNPLTAPIIGNVALVNASKTLHDTLDTWAPPTGIALTEIAGWGEETLKTIAYYQGAKSTCTAFKADSTCAAMISTPALQYSPKTVIDGDGTVVVPSALWTPSATGVKKYWVDLDSYGSSNFGFTVNRKHADILEVPQLRTFLQNIITNANTGPLPQFISTSTPVNTDESEVLLKFTLHSPLTLNLYDDLGNHTGFSTTTNSLEENIPDSRYLSFGEVQYISVPSSANLRLIMDGYADGSFTFDMEEAQGSTVIATTTFSGIPSFTHTKVTMDIPKNGGIEGASDLRIDVQGDGTIDVKLEPKLNGTVILLMPLTITAEDKKITLGDPIPSFIASITDALENTVGDDITGAPECTTTAMATSPAGKYQITCSLGTLSSEKYEFTTFVPGTLTIQYRWDGFLQPIKDTAHQVGQNTSIFKGGSTVPVKFQLKDINGTPVQAATAPVWLAPQAGMSDGVYKWDSTAQQYVYNWSTKGLVAGWYKIYAKLDDGQTYSVTIGLK